MLKKLGKGLWNYRAIILIVLTPLLLLPIPILIQTKEAGCAFVLLIMAIYWMTEVIPLSMTAMLPAILFPILGVMKSSMVAKEYFKDFHILLVGVICLATSIEKWGLHRRIALRLVKMVGVNPAWLMLGFMSGCALLSMWVQNTSAVAMVMPIVDAVLQQILKAKESGYAGKDNPGLELDESDDWTEKEKGTKDIGSGKKDPEPCTRVRMNSASKDWKEEEKTGRLEEMKSAKDTSDPNKERKGSECESEGASGSNRDRMMCKAMSIGIAYSSSIGGITTLPGTSPNLIFSEYLQQIYPDCDSINFGNWLLLCLPISIIMLLLTWIWLYWLFIGSDFSFLWKCRGEASEKEKAAKKVIDDEYNSLGPMSSQEIFTGVVFVFMVLLWLTRSPGFIPGWASFFPHDTNYITDATVALMLGLLFFIVPAYGPVRKYEAMITWKDFEAAMPWTVALLVGGGFALAEGAKVSGLSLWVAELMKPLGNLPVMVIITVICIIVTTLTEVTSNAATITIFLPILSPLAEAIHVNPLYILIPTTLVTSFSFLLPVSNPPNAVVFAYGHITIMDMVKAGLGVNVIGVLSVLMATATWGVPLFSLTTYPDWAPTHPSFNTTAP
ncbi:solute carrier family 13 member 1 [Cololabis saira]|uniref:solute carrier family 13 member 1 n=1 Tax=Cololabis saira TaxID=129043 RepID=UPI002AD4F44A|nr:solute carrier family 13 member 1 [Cololabis saira]